MNKNIVRLVICEQIHNSTTDLDNIVVIYDDNSIENIDKVEAKKIIKKMYNSNLSSEEVNSRILFLSEENFDDYISLYRKSEESLITSKEKEKYYFNPNIDYDDIDLGLSIDDLKDPKKIRKKLNLLRKIKIRAIAAIVGGTVFVGSIAFGIIKSRDKNDYKGFIIKSEMAKEKNNEKDTYKVEKQDFYDLLEMSNNINQVNFMRNMSTYLVIYNDSFAKQHKDNGIKPALKWDEVVSLKLAYNNYNKSVLNDIFIGTELSTDTLINNYKGAVEQLREAFVLEEKQSLISLDYLIDDYDLKKEYNNIHYKYLNLKENDFSNKKKINKLYKEVYEIINEYDLKETRFIFEPLVLAMNDLLKDSGYKNKYKELLDKYYDSSDYTTYRNISFKNIAESTFGNNGKDVVLYEEFKQAEIKDLKKRHSYKINNRKLSLLREYKRNIRNVKVYSDKDYDLISKIVDDMEYNNESNIKTYNYTI